jgi:hypothetical protein
MRRTGQVCLAVAGYHFSNVGQLSADYRQGLFTAAFLQGRASEA